MSVGHALGASYRLVEQVGSGAAGLVWKAVDTRTEEIVAAKVLRKELATDTAVVERFVRERTLLVGLQHRNLVTVRDLIVDGDQLGIVMDYVAGGSLRDVLEADRSLPPALAVEVAGSVLAGLDAAHRRGVLHRDIKPDNVLLEPGWRTAAEDGVRVTDFGIAEMITDTDTGTPRSSTGMLGTPEYMSPELISAGTAGPAADVYGVGVLLYELLAGRTPFAGPGTDFTVAYRHVTAEVPKIDVPQDLQRILSQLLDKRPSARPSAAEAASQLRRLVTSLGDVPAIAVREAPRTFAASERPATALRGVAPDPVPDGTAEGEDSGTAAAPDLGAAAHATRLRPLPRRPIPELTSTEEEVGDSAVARPWWRSRRVIIAIAGAMLILAGGVVIAVQMTSGNKDAPEATTTTFEASQTDASTPTGLTISRTAEYDPSTSTIQLSIRYATQNSVLQSPFLEVLPGMPGATTCPKVTWPNSEQKLNLSTVTGMAVPCGWSIEQAEIPPQSTQEVRAEIYQPIATQDELQTWLDTAATATDTAVSDPEVTSTAYPAQRLQNIDVQTSPRIVSEKTVKVTLVPVWPSGADEVNPLYRSPSVGEPSSMLVAVAGGLDGIRFTDGCSGALSVSTDGLTVTALSQTPECTVGASVGNFTDLSSAPFAIVTRGR